MSPPSTSLLLAWEVDGTRPRRVGRTARCRWRVSVVVVIAAAEEEEVFPGMSSIKVMGDSRISAIRSRRSVAASQPISRGAARHMAGIRSRRSYGRHPIPPIPSIRGCADYGRHLIPSIRGCAPANIPRTRVRPDSTCAAPWTRPSFCDYLPFLQLLKGRQLLLSAS